MKTTHTTVAVLMVVMVATVGFGQDHQTHRFFDKKNLGLFTFNVAANTVDAASTQRFMHLQNDMRQTFSTYPTGGDPWTIHCACGEWNLVARPLVNKGWVGQVVASYGIGTGGAILGSYLAHRTGHHRMERLVPILSGIAVLGFGLHNYQYGREDCYATSGPWVKRC